MTYWTTRCMTCKRLMPVVKVREHGPNDQKQTTSWQPETAMEVKGTTACGHTVSFITTWRQFAPQIQPIGARG